MVDSTGETKTAAMFKLIRRLFLLGAALLVVIVLGRESIAIWIAEDALEELTGFQIVIGRFDLKLNKPILIAREVTLRNPKGVYREPIAMKIDLIEAEYEPSSFLRRKPHFQRLTVQISEVAAVKNIDGQMNIQRLQRQAVRADPRGGPGALKIDEFVLSIDRILYFNERRENSKPEICLANARNQIHKNISNPEDLKRLVLDQIIQSLPNQ